MNNSKGRVSYLLMKNLNVIVPWREGLHLRRAATLVQLAKFFRSAICLRCGHKTADLRSIISIISLCASMGTALEVEVTGEDEQEAASALKRAFSPQGGYSSLIENSTYQ